MLPQPIRVALVAACAVALIGCSGAAPRQVGATAGPRLAAPGQADTRPGFSDLVDELTVRVGEGVRITLPPATGGNGGLRYTLSSPPPGLAFNAEARTLTGTPEKAGEYPMTYRVEDSDANTDPSDADVLEFQVIVEQAAGAGGNTPAGPGGVAAPANLAVVSSDRSVTLSWAAPPALAGITRHEYRYQIDQDYPHAWTAIPDSGPGGVNQAGFTVTGLTNDTTYAFQVRAIGSSGASGPSNEATAVPAPGICDRTPQVAATIIEYLDQFGPQFGVTRVSECGEVTGAHLAAVLALDLTHRRPPLTALKRGDFAGLTSITGLYLHSNALTTLPDGVFAGLLSLETLALYNNDLASVTAATFVGLPALDSLHMQNNALGRLADGTFAGLPALASLHLGNNGLTELRRGMIAGLSSLEELYLWDNEIVELAADTFTGLTALQTLDLQAIHLQRLPAGLFARLSSLEYLDLGNNELTEVPDGVFTGLSSLTDLRLFVNELEVLPEGAFAGLSRLERLYLSDNELTALPARAFDGLSSLISLLLARNAVDPVPLMVALEADGALQFKAAVPSGAPFDIVLPVEVTNGSLAGGTTTVTVPKGHVDSGAVSVVRTPGSTGTVSVQIGDVPDPPASHGGYALVKGARLSL